MAGEFKFATFLWVAAGLLIPLWPISLPFCLFMAYRSYKGGSTPIPKLAELQAAVELHKSGNLTDAELQNIKSRTLGTQS